MESLNLSLFSLLNAPEHASPIMIHYATFIANDLLYVMIMIFAVLWLRGNTQIKKQILKAFIFTCITLSISQLISHFFYSPRPFVLGLGQTLIPHDATGSFPSNHMTIFSSIAFAYYFSDQRQIGRLLIAVAWLVAWARIYVGVHFPIDMLGGFFISLFVSLAGFPLWQKYQNSITHFILVIYGKIFGLFIQKGWIR